MAKYLFLILISAGLAMAQNGRTNFPWWNNPIVNTLNLSDAQQKQIRATVQEFRNRLVDARATVEKAEGALDDAFDTDPVDARKGAEAIEQTATARAELTRVSTQMSFKLRGVLTARQWQELRRRENERGGPGPNQQGPGPGGPPLGGNRFGNPPRPGGPQPPPQAPSQPQPPNGPRPAAPKPPNQQ